MMNARALAADILNKVIKQQQSLDHLLEKVPQHKDLGFVKELCFGTLRWYYRLNIIAENLLHKPLAHKYFEVHCLLLCGLYQIIYLKTPPHAAVSETVNAAIVLKKDWAKGLLNKTLRTFINEQAHFLKIADNSLDGFYAHPQWLIGKIKKAYPEHYSHILENNNKKAPLTLRVNQQKISTQGYIKLLSEHNILAKPFTLAPWAVQLENAVPVEQLPGFFEGLCSVQDLAGQLAAILINAQPGQTILDACAAPGSKSTHLLETYPLIKKLIALDINAERLSLLKSNIQRLQLDPLKIDVMEADASQAFTEQYFDHILLDAPCSGTGVIRRHPDIKVLRHPEDIQEQTKLQAKLLANLWGMLKPGGSLLYSTCSILPEENEKQIQQFLAKHQNAKSCTLSIGLGIQQTCGLQILPGEHEADGFYYCLLFKQ